ncbi:ABC transporter substrate-binding protein [Nocardioides sp. GXQ0305]|uniref:ABC transporter substrate-binding protein n=1 Tax=Nocardioides sp. GXQ0305 TaxID=3423912 RepID=UPI003D7EB5A3
MKIPSLSRARTLTAVAAAASLVLAACSAGSGTSPSGDDSGGGGTSDEQLTVGLVAEPVNLDFTTTDGAAIPQALLYNVYENLVEVDQEGEIVPSLAESWEVSEDGTTYTFQLVDGATFANGEPFTAQDATFSIERVSSDWTISLKAAMDVVKSVEAPSDTELVVTLKQPSNDWLYRMTTRVGAMFDEQGVSDLANDPVGTGPYDVGDWTRGDSITLTRNDDYWGEAPYFETVTLQYFKDATALNNAFLSDTIDVIGTVQTPESLEQFEGNDAYQVIEGTTNGEVVLSMNNESGPMSDLKARQAARHAIDHQALVDTCWAGRGELIGSMVPPTDPWFEDRTGDYPYDPDRAEQLLQQSEAADETVRLRLPTLPYADACGQVVKSQLEEVGFTVELDQLEFPAAWLNTVFTNADYDLSIIAHVEPRDMGAVFGDPTYYTRYGDPEFQDLLAQADRGTPDEQVDHMRQAAQKLSDDAAADWLFLLPNLVVADADVTGLPQNAISESFDVTGLGRE